MRLKRFSGFLNEGLSTILYHYTHADALRSILEKDRLSCSAAMGTSSDNEINKKKFFFFSLTRGKHGQTGYPRTKGNNTLVRIEIDGDKLGHRYRGEAEDYWQRPRDPKDPLYGKMSPADLKHRMMADNEMEERIVTDKPYIEKASTYMKSVDICIDRKLSKFAIAHMQEIAKMCEDKHIPLKFYNDRAEWDKRGKKTVELSIVEQDHDYDDDTEYKSGLPGPWNISDLLKWAIVQSPDNKEKVKKYYEKYSTMINGGQSPETLFNQAVKAGEDLSRDLEYAYDREIYDNTASLESHISNDRGKDDEALKAAFVILFNAVRAAKCTGIKDFVKKMSDQSVDRRRSRSRSSS